MKAEPSQRERLIAAMIELSARRGYHRVSIARACSHAGVSSMTFYEQFASKEECFLAAYRSSVQRVFGGIGALGVGGDEWPARTRPALAGLLEGVRRDPDAARLLFIEALAGGPRVRAESDRARSAVERTTEQLLRTPRHGETVDIPSLAVAGALRHLDLTLPAQ